MLLRCGRRAVLIVLLWLQALCRADGSNADLIPRSHPTPPRPACAKSGRGRRDRGDSIGHSNGHVLSTAARVNNELVRARDAGDATALCKIIKAHHSAFNSVNFVTSWRALLQIRRGLRPHAGALAGAASAPVDGEPADGIDAGRAHKKRGSELESAARVALKQARYEAAADLAQQAAVAFEDAARSGVKLGWRMAKDSLGLHRRARGLLYPSGASNSSAAMDARAPGATHGSRVDVQLLDATTKVAAPLTRSARVSLSSMAATAKQSTLQHACAHSCRCGHESANAGFC